MLPKALANSLREIAGYKISDKAEAFAEEKCTYCGKKVEGRIHTKAGREWYNDTGVCEECFDELSTTDELNGTPE